MVALGLLNSFLPTFAKEAEPDSIIPGINRIQTWKDTAQNPENPSDLTFKAQFPDKAWWQQFNDPYLNRYIEAALLANPQLALARERITEERALARYQMAQQLPSLNFSPSVSRIRNSATEIPSFSNSSATSQTNTVNSGSTPSTQNTNASSSSSGLSSSSFLLGKPFNFYNAPLQANYEADLFLRNRDLTRSARKQAEATMRDYQTSLIALVTDVAGAYFNILSEDKLITHQKNYIQFAEADLQAERAKNAAGLVSQEAVVIKEGTLTNSKAVLQDYYRLQGTYCNQLAILLGKTPEQMQDLPRADLDQFEIPNTVETGIPSNLITRRPDILSAEALLAKSKIDVRVARKAFLPVFNLTSQAGYATATLSKLLEWQSRSTLWEASLVQPLFSGGALRANLRVTQARNREQLQQYQQTILTAFEEVDNALVALKSHRNAYQNYSAANNSLNQELGFQQNQLTQGAVAAADLYPTQLQIVQAQEGLVSAKLLGLTDVINLYKALGGGF